MSAKAKGKRHSLCKWEQILRKSELSKVVAKEYDRTKGSGARKLVYLLKHRFVGLNQGKIQEILNRDKCQYRRNLRFLNKPKLKPIRARDVHIRHQVDLMDMRGDE